MNKFISFEVKEKVAYVGFGLSKTRSMTILDMDTMTELSETIEHLHKIQADLVGAIFFSHVDGCFLAGADINLIASMKSEGESQDKAEQGQNIYNRLEDLSIPTVVCVDGVCLGGGLEFSLSANVILASNSPKTQLGLPEVKLGILPGFGGTYRLPKKVGLPNALDMILTGKTLRADKAKKCGLVAEVFPKENLLKKAVEYFHYKKPSKGLSDQVKVLMTENPLTHKIIFQKAKEGVLKKTHGFYQAPLKILEVMEKGMLKSRSSYLALEAEAFGQLSMSEQSKNLQHIYFMSESSKKYKGPKGTGSLKKIEKGAALGAGTMGGGIAWLMAENNMFPIMKDLTVEALNLGLKQSAQNFQGALKRKKMTFDEFNRKQRSISAQLDFNGFKKVDLLVEAVVENMEIKKKVFAEVENYVSPDCLLTSNTSSLSVQEMSTALKDPSRFLGLHFFNPVHMMPLVEIIIHDKTSPETIEACYQWVLKTKKTPVVVKDGPGFLVNRILTPFLNEAGHMLELGVSVEDIDKAATDFGMPMGPCRLLDEVGIDVGLKVGKVMFEGIGSRLTPSKISDKLVEKKFLGKKTSKGFYLYDEKGKVNGLNPEVQELLPEKSLKLSREDIQKRLILPMINEAAAILSDGIVTSSSSVDLGLIFGIGFPPFRGGLLRYADAVGVQSIVSDLEEYAKSVDSARFAPCSFILELKNKNTSFYQSHP